MKELYNEREYLRNQIRTFWKEGRTWTPIETAVSNKLKEVHAEIVELELLDETKPRERVVFSVFGYRPKHNYFRTKRFTANNLKEAIVDLQNVKKDKSWNIPTIIVKETYFRKTSPAMVDFDSEMIDLGFSDTQELIEKSMCGNRKYRWKDLIHKNDDRYTY